MLRAEWWIGTPYDEVARKLRPMVGCLLKPHAIRVQACKIGALRSPEVITAARREARAGKRHVKVIVGPVPVAVLPVATRVPVPYLSLATVGRDPDREARLRQARTATTGRIGLYR